MFDTTTYSLTKVTYVNYILYGSEPTHFNNNFFTSNGVIKLSTANELEDITGKIAIYVDLYSAGIILFKGGTITYIGYANNVRLTADS